MSGEIASLAQQLGAAVELTMNPAIPMEQRHQAFNQLEEFKENSPYGSQCGFYLVESSESPVVRHFGLKILEDVVKARWNTMSGEEKVFIKESLMKMISSGTRHLTVEHLFIKDALARVVVELVKREWPQHWPTLLQELDTLCRQGETQTELVMFVLLRLVEDVALLQTLEQSQRRKEIYSELTANMEHIFAFLLALLEKHYGAYKASGNAEHCRVSMAILNTFTALVEWVNIQHVMANKKYLLRCLTHLLSDPRLQLAAAECLLGIVGWKAGKMTERAQLLCLFDTDMMIPLFAATENAEKHKLDCDHYNFLKKMVEILTGLGEQLCALWTKESPRSLPNLTTYLDALLSFTRHPSQSVNLYANDLWAKFFRHADISQDPTFLSYQPKWIEIALRKVVKVGYPERDDNPACSYSQLDFDNDEEFLAFFIKYRLCILENVRVVANGKPLLPLTLLDQWLRATLSKPTPDMTDLEAISSLLDSTFSKLMSVEQVQPVSHLAVPLLQLLLSHTASSPSILSELLSCISALFSVVLLAPEALNPILSRIFTPLSTPSDTINHSKEIRTLRRHSCSLLVKLGTKFPAILLPSFTFLKGEISRLNTTGLLSKMEHCTLMEALVIISNQLGNYDRQAIFLGEMLAPVLNQFRSLEAVYRDPALFMEFVGLTSLPVVMDRTSDTVDQFGQNRSSITMIINMVLAVTRRAEAPQDQNHAQNGGFTAPLGGQLVVRNPAGAHVCSVLRNLLLLAHTLNKMFNSEMKSKLNPGFAKAFDLLEVDRNNMLGLPGSRSAKNELVYQVAKLPEPVTRMQNFVTELFDNVQHLLSHYCTNIGNEFYHQPNLSNDLSLSVFANLPGLPDFRLRSINRTFFKFFITKCPASCITSVVLPVLRQSCPFMLGHLKERWSYLKKVRESPNFDEENTDSQEVLDDVIIRVMAREYIDTVKAVLTSGKGSDAQSDNSNHVDGPASLSLLGEQALADGTLSTCLVGTCLSALSWPDSPASSKACNLVELILPRLVEQGSLGPEDANSIMMTVLKAFQDMGHHEANNIALTHLALTCYESLRPRFVGIRDVFSQVPNCQPEDLQKFDARIMAGLNPAVKGGDKAKKDMFKKMIAALIGRETAKLHQKEIVIKNLPNLMPSKVKAKTPSLDEQTRNGEDTGLASLFGQ
eukprot:GFUD01019534.1.p1 GENE.GFUD01019534.1~~GFUD01019534.1.p1  ORF type:complete len:1164 (-),score=281.09 GFUD01019534.1:284-3775(-)